MKLSRLKNYYLSFIFLLFGCGLNAQNSTIIQTGVTISKLSPFLIYSTQYNGIKFRPGINVGFLKCKRFRFSYDFRLRYGLLYQRIGEKFHKQIHIPAFDGQWSDDSPPIHIESYSRSPFEDRYSEPFQGNDGRLKFRSLVISLELYFNDVKS
jgi:hypothetical protein